jgi:hypothetical protein
VEGIIAISLIILVIVVLACRIRRSCYLPALVKFMKQRKE